MWLDADDVLLPGDAQKLRELKNSLPKDVNTVMMRYNTAFDENGEPTFFYYRERLIKRTAPHHWKGKVHEAIEYVGKVLYSSAAVTHRSVKKYMETVISGYTNARSSRAKAFLRAIGSITAESFIITKDMTKPSKYLMNICQTVRGGRKTMRKLLKSYPLAVLRQGKPRKRLPYSLRPFRKERRGRISAVRLRIYFSTARIIRQPLFGTPARLSVPEMTNPAVL